MPYTKTVWEDELPLSTPVKYSMTDDTLGAVATSAVIVPVTSITPGTPVNAQNLNNIEDGLETAQALAESADATATAAIPKSLSAGVGDFLYSTAAGIWASLVKPTVPAVLKNDNFGYPSWKSLTDFLPVVGRVGGSATNWSTIGTTPYIPTNPKIQVGNFSFVWSYSDTSPIGTTTRNGSIDIIFPVAFIYVPIVFVILDNNENNPIVSTTYRKSVTSLNSTITCARILVIREFMAYPSISFSETITGKFIAIGETA